MNTKSTFFLSCTIVCSLDIKDFPNVIELFKKSISQLIPALIMEESVEMRKRQRICQVNESQIAAERIY